MGRDLLQEDRDGLRDRRLTEEAHILCLMQETVEMLVKHAQASQAPIPPIDERERDPEVPGGQERRGLLQDRGAGDQRGRAHPFMPSMIWRCSRKNTTRIRRAAISAPAICQRIGLCIAKSQIVQIHI